MKRTNDFISGWNTLGRTMAFYRFLLAAVIVLAIVMGVVVAYALRHDPLVVVEKCENKHFHQAKRTPIKLGQRDVEEYARGFIRTLYGGGDFSCMASEGLGKRLKQFSGYKGQYVGKIKVSLQEKLTLVDFDLIMSVNNVPIALKKSVELQIQKKKANVCNHVGLYVNGINERGTK